jgi:hypothetical protein
MPPGSVKMEKFTGGMLVERTKMERIPGPKNPDKVKVRKWPAWKKIYPDSLGIVTNRRFGPYWKSRLF